MHPALHSHASDWQGNIYDQIDLTIAVADEVCELTPIYAEVMILHLMGMPDEWIAADLQVHVKTVAKYIRHASNKIRDRIINN